MNHEKLPEARRRENAQRNSAQASRDRFHREPVDFDWDAAIARMKAMLDRWEAK